MSNSTTTRKTTKKATALKIMRRMFNRKTEPTRQQVLAELVAKADLSPAGASTYYAEYMNESEGWV